MNLLEFNDRVMISKKKTVSVPDFDNDKLIEFKELLAISPNMKNVFSAVDDSNAFFKMFPDVKKVIGAKICAEVFYACKLGYYYDGIPSKLVYILNKAVKNCGRDFANLTVNSAVNLLRTYASAQYRYDGSTICVKDVLDNVFGKSVDLLTTAKMKIKTGDVWEVFIPDVERVALMPDDIASMISYGDCDKLSFDINKGIMLGDVPVRTMNGRVGITRNDFDLRECI